MLVYCGQGWCMKQNGVVESGWWGLCEGWFEVGYYVLIENGVEVVKILLLVKQFNLLCISFYWFFQDREVLLEVLIDGWYEKIIVLLIWVVMEYVDSVVEVMLNVLVCFLLDNFDVWLEFVLCSWVFQDVGIVQKIEVVDIVCFVVLCDMLMCWDYFQDVVDICVCIIYLMQIGYILMCVYEDLVVWMLCILIYVQIYIGILFQLCEMVWFSVCLLG